MTRRTSNPFFPTFHPAGPTYQPPAQQHSRTSRLAAQEAKPRAGTQRHRVLMMLRNWPVGVTDEEMQDELKMNPSTQRPRRIELVTAGLVKDSGATRRTRSDRQAVVWIVTAKGRQK